MQSCKCLSTSLPSIIGLWMSWNFLKFSYIYIYIYGEEISMRRTHKPSPCVWMCWPRESCDWHGCHAQCVMYIVYILMLRLKPMHATLIYSTDVILINVTNGSINLLFIFSIDNLKWPGSLLFLFLACIILGSGYNKHSKTFWARKQMNYIHTMILLAS